MRLSESDVGILWEHPTSARRPLKIILGFDCKEPMSLSSVEACAEAIRENKADCAIIVHSGQRSEDVVGRIEEEEKRIGTAGIINTLTLTRRELDLLLMINRIKDEMRRGDRSKLEVEKLEREVRILWSKFDEEAERIVRDLDAKGYIVYKYNLHGEDPSILLSLSLSGGDVSTAYNEYIKFFFPFPEGVVPQLQITRAKERIQDKGLIDENWKITFPAFLQSVLADLNEGKRRISDISRKFIVVDNIDLQGWLGFLASLNIVRPSGDYWLLRSLTDLGKELKQKRVKDPKGMNKQDKYGGTLANFLAGFNYDTLKTKLKEIRKKFKEETGPVQGDFLEFIRNVIVYHAIYVNGYDRLQAVVVDAEEELKRSRSELNTANDEIERAKEDLSKLNAKLDNLTFGG